MKNIKSRIMILLLISGLVTALYSCKDENNNTIPVLTTQNVTSITPASALSGGDITDDGGADVTARGVCWGTASNPVITGSHTSDGTGTGTFTSSITGLTSGTMYYVRAYATNSEGTAYGNEVSFTTTTSGSLASLTTTEATSITSISSVSGGNITDDGGSDVTARGVCWSLVTNPTISDSTSSDGTGTGIFTSNITGLVASTTYYVRAYATNEAGTAYGNEVSFTTTAVALATLTTTEVTGLTQSSAISGGNITSDGGDAITARGVCWATTANPVVSGTHTVDGTGTGTFISNISGLSAGTVYYVRAYATNSAGTSYGEEVSFTTVSGPGTNEVWIQSYAFSPDTITVAAGTTITWTNKDVAAHTVTSTTGLFDSGSIGNNMTYSHTFSTAGNFPYYCTYHPSMTAVVIVN